jgi:DNA invertase Pin-like site-specific DNA recombinase
MATPSQAGVTCAKRVVHECPFPNRHVRSWTTPDTVVRMESAARPLRLDLIIRTSQRKLAGQSPKQQRQQAEAICAQGGHEIVAVHDSGRSESGKTMDRGSINAFRARHREGLTDGVVVGYLDRLGRAPIEESMTFVRELVGDGGALVAADWSADPIDLADSNTEDMLVFRMQMNRSQWNKAAERYQLSQRNAIKAGKWIGRAPVGFEKVSEGERKGCLTEHEHYGPIMAEAYRVAAIDGHAAVVDYLVRMVPERAWWDAPEVRRVLACKAYLGEVHYGSYEPNLHAHPPLIDRDTWQAAQTDAKDIRASATYLLSKVVHCEGCGEGMTGQFQQFRKTVAPIAAIAARTATAAAGPRSVLTRLEAHVRERVAALMGDRKVRVRFEVAGLQDARDALASAKAGRDAFADDLDRQEALGDEAANRTAAAHRRRVEQAQAHYEQVAKQAIRNRELPGAEKVRHDDDTLLRALRLLATRDVIPVVGRGRRGDGSTSRPPIASPSRASMIAPGNSRRSPSITACITRSPACSGGHGVSSIWSP